MHSIRCKTYHESKEVVKEYLEKGYTWFKIELDDGSWLVYYKDYLDLEDIY